MQIQWVDEVELTICDGEGDPGTTTTINCGETDEVTITEDKGGFVDMQFETGWMAFNVDKSWYKEVKK